MKTNSLGLLLFVIGLTLGAVFAWPFIQVPQPVSPPRPAVKASYPTSPTPVSAPSPVPPMGYLFGGGMVLVGLFQLLTKDLTWRWVNYRLMWQGIRAERTDWWDFQVNVSGGVALFIGVVMIMLQRPF